jgi:hypothetical protein
MSDPVARGLWVAIALTFSLIVGVGGGALQFMAGANPATAVITGGSAFAASTALCLVLLSFLRG